MDGGTLSVRESSDACPADPFVFRIVAPGAGTVRLAPLDVVGRCRGRYRPPARHSEIPSTTARTYRCRSSTLEIVTDDVDATCSTHAKLCGVRFGEPDAGLGGARTAALAGGGKLGVRGPLHVTETPVVRSYVLVDDIEVAAQAAVEAGGEIAHPPMAIPGHGTFAIYILGGVQHGLWQV